MVEKDLERWLEFVSRPKQHEINRKEMELIARLHSHYYKHRYEVPCSCNGAIYRRWIQDLNKLV
jgi:hypothetical protein